MNRVHDRMDRMRSEQHDIPREEQRLAGDLDALRCVTARDLEDIQTTVRRARARAHSREGFVMSTLEKFTHRPLWATAAVAVAIAIALLFIPVSYERTVGQEVSITLAGSGDGPARARSVADAVRAATGSPQIRLEIGSTTAVTARVPGCSHAEATVMGRALVKELGQKGIQASFTVEPWVEEVTSNVYAQVANHWREIRVETQGRSEDEIERDVTAQLEQMGFSNPEVTFDRTGEGSQLGIRAGGQDGRIEARIERRIEGGGDEPAVDVPLLDCSDLAGLPDAEIKAAVEDRLRERGIEAEVSVENGRIEIQARREVHP